MTLVADNNGSAVVKDVEGQAQKLLVRKGDRVIRIGSQDVQRKKLKDILRILRSSPQRPLVIVVSRIVHGLGTSAASWSSTSAVVEVVHSTMNTIPPPPPPPKNTRGIHRHTKKWSPLSKQKTTTAPRQSWTSSNRSAVDHSPNATAGLRRTGGAYSRIAAVTSSNNKPAKSWPPVKQQQTKAAKSPNRSIVDNTPNATAGLRSTRSSPANNNQPVRRVSGSFNTVYRKQTVELEKIFFRALYDFQGEQEDELSFRQGDMITFLAKVDNNWNKGMFRGKEGIFPSDYAEPMRERERRPSWQRR